MAAKSIAARFGFRRNSIGHEMRGKVGQIIQATDERINQYHHGLRPAKIVGNPYEMKLNSLVKATVNSLAKRWRLEREIRKDMHELKRNIYESLLHSGGMLKQVLRTQQGQQIIEGLSQLYLMLRTGEAKNKKQIDKIMGQLKEMGVEFVGEQGKVFVSIMGQHFRIEGFFGSQRANYMTEYIKKLKGIHHYLQTGMQTEESKP
ncbi:MAG: hypothetical protein ABIA76_01765 [Candidatus Diapherotrites archaeon]